MYTIYIDGNLLFSTAQQDDAHIILNPKLSLDIESAGSFSFVMPPGHALHDAIYKMKSIVTVYQDDALIFRGRVLEDERDFYNQKDVYCEGDRSFLLDSLWAEQTVSGTAQDLFRSLISNHNAQVETEKQFTVGRITAVDANTTYEGEMSVETRRYWDTSTMIEERLISVYGGYIRTRTEGGTTYIDWLEDFEEESSQSIAFSVNMLDLKDKMDAGDVFTCLIPLGYSEIQDDGTYSDPVDITSVNGGLNYIQDDDAVALYGKIWRSKTWGNTKDPAQLLVKARKHMETGAELRTLTLTAVDMCFTDGNADMIRIGTKVQIESDPHGIDMHKVCAKMDIDLLNPEKTPYTFGVKPRTLSEAVIRTEKETDKLSGRGGGRSAKEEAEDILRWAKITVDEANARIDLSTGEIDNLTGRMSKAEIDIDGINAEIKLITGQTNISELEKRITQAEIEIDGTNAQIMLKADATIVDDLGERVTSAEIEIDGMNSEITLKADKVYVDAQITTVRTLIAEEIEAAIADLDLSFSETIVTDYITVTNRATLAALALDGSNVSKTTIPVVTSFTQASGETAETNDYTLLTTSVGNTITHDVAAGETKTFDAV